MRRTQIYLTDEQDRLVAARAEDAGVAKAEVIRSLLDAGLGLSDGAQEQRRAISETFGILPDAPDWPDWLSEVRGTGADERLSRLEG